MLSKEILRTVEIPQYIREVQLSKAQRPKYFELKGTDCRSWRIPDKYILKEYKKLVNPVFFPYYLKDGYCIGIFKKNRHPIQYENLLCIDIAKDDRFFLCTIANEVIDKVIINDKKVGTPSIMRINAQDFYAGFASPHMRGKIINEIKFNMLPHLKDLPVIDNASYPIRIELEIVDCVKNYTDRAAEGSGTRWDLDNRAYPYFKSFLDLLVTGSIGDVKYFEPKLTDDDRLHVTGSGGALFTPVENFEERKLRFHIYKDLRPEILTNKHYQDVTNQQDTVPKEQPW